MLSFAKLCATLKNKRIESDLTGVEHLKQLQRKPRKKSEASTGFEPMTSINTGAMFYQLSYEALLEAGQV